MIKTYHIYIIKNFLKKFLIISFVFLGLIFLMNILEEIKMLNSDMTKRRKYVNILVTCTTLIKSFLRIFIYFFIFEYNFTKTRVAFQILALKLCLNNNMNVSPLDKKPLNFCVMYFDCRKFQTCNGA